MELKTFRFDYSSLGLEKATIEKYMGYDNGSPEPIPELIEATLDNVAPYCEIQGGYRIFETISRDKKNHLFTIENVTFDVKSILSNQIRKAEKAALFLCTAGPGVEKWSKEEMAGGDLMKGYVIDVIASEIVEKAIDRIHDILERDMKGLGFGVTDRYSPGYCGWQVSEQPKLFSFFPDNYCGIQLSETSLMYPIKSVSGLIGIGLRAERKGYTCDFCDQINCVYRKQRSKFIS
jgi:hypothetical protein